MRRLARTLKRAGKAMRRLARTLKRAGKRHPDRREGPGDRRHLHPEENWYRDVAMLALAVLWLWTSLSLQTTNNHVLSGRRLALKVSCAIDQAEAEAGRQVLLAASGTRFSARFERNLEKLGYQPATGKQLKAAGDAYVLAISRSVERQIGARGAHLIGPDGELRCDRLLRLATAP